MKGNRNHTKQQIRKRAAESAGFLPDLARI